MTISCPNPMCVLDIKLGPNIRPIVRNGSYFRASDSRKISRFFCRLCRCYFSRATFSERYYQKRRRINEPLKRLLVSGFSQRRAAQFLKVNRKTIVRRFRFLAQQARLEHDSWLKKYSKLGPLKVVQFDDLETSEHTKCKPLSVAIAVEPAERKILNFQVSKMPAKGHLAQVARVKYGARKDERPKGWNHLMKALTPLVIDTVTFKSDDNPHYPKYVRRHFPHASHITVKGGRGAIAGQGELKKLRFDPIFSLNHTCAMLRANLNRLVRRTWCSTKTIQGLIDHVSLYVPYHNQVLTSKVPQS